MVYNFIIRIAFDGRICQSDPKREPAVGASRWVRWLSASRAFGEEPRVPPLIGRRAAALYIRACKLGGTTELFVPFRVG